MKEILRLLEESTWNHGDDTPYLELYSDFSGMLIAHGETIFEFEGKEDLIRKFKALETTY